MGSSRVGLPLLHPPPHHISSKTKNMKDSPDSILKKVHLLNAVYQYLIWIIMIYVS